MKATIEAIDIWKAEVRVCEGEECKSNILPNRDMVQVAKNLIANGVEVEVLVGGPIIKMGSSLKEALLEMSDLSFEEQGKIMAGGLKHRSFTINAQGGE